jgi:cation transport ATPase
MITAMTASQLRRDAVEVATGAGLGLVVLLVWCSLADVSALDALFAGFAVAMAVMLPVHFAVFHGSLDEILRTRPWRHSLPGGVGFVLASAVTPALLANTGPYRGLVAFATVFAILTVAWLTSNYLWVRATGRASRKLSRGSP